MDHYIAENNNNDTILTLGNLFEQDLPSAYILPVYPSPYNDNFRFKNKTKYRIFNDPQTTSDPIRFLVPLRFCCIAGNELPILVHKLPSEFLSAHWKKWLPHFIEPVIKTIDEGIADKNPLITSFPLEEIPEEKHAVDPDMHYHILEKTAIPEIGVPYPRYFTEDNIVFPCMIKLNQSTSLIGYRNYVTWNREEFENVSKMVKGIFGADVSYIISEFIQDVRATLDCSFYVTKSGRIIWIGVQECVMEGYGYVAGTVDWHLQEQYKERLYDKYVVPVAAYLHKKGYFGIVGIDIITSPSGDYLTDLNPRLNGNTQFIMLAASMAKLGLSKSLFQIHVSFDVSGEQLVKKANSINETSAGRVVIIASADEDEKCYAAVSVSADSMKLAESLYASLCSKD